jgi:hypothetical protein
MGLKIHGIASNGAIDSSGETIDVSGIDITDLVEGRGILNFEHEKGAEDIIGAVTYAKKILKESDAQTSAEKKFWKISEGPYVYIIAELFDDEEHHGAIACAAMVRYYARKSEKMLVGFSIEGQTLERDGNELKRTVGRKVAFTLRPCNKACISEMLDDAELKDSVKKFEQDSPTHNKTIEVDELVFDDSVQELRHSVQQLNKTLTAGGYNVAPSQLTGGSALAVEDRTFKNKLKSVVRDWPRTRPLKEWMKAQMPEVSDEFLQHFDNISQDYSLKKSSVFALHRVSATDNLNGEPSENQSSLLEGLYLDPQQPVGIKQDFAFGRNDAGEDVHIKSSPLDHKNCCDYATIAHEAFGLQNHVPSVAMIPNPHDKSGQAPNLLVQKWHSNLATPMTDRQRFISSAQKSKEDGSFHKLAMLDMILGGSRNSMNYGFGKDGKPVFFDNNNSFNYQGGNSHSHGIIGNDTPHMDAAAWITTIDPKKLVGTMSRLGRNIDEMKKASFNLKAIQKMANGGINFSSMQAKLNPPVVEEKHND